ncbi:MAG: caspase, EACC1-associated type [Aulosira sp. ZfuVER01]|nr:GUN4 domain-containing protein [Aulosira sp. ZfuVER01]MDZ8001825.1 GUN4 domain-containing protein [Aulosira sp. DedVER01a]MDZ8053300.1 GUN4 domain-containing protein [Aulosira sp. ZfuCHP01]
MAKLALLIGISEYQPGLNALPSAVQDIKAMQRVLQHPEMGDFADTDITVLENPPRQIMEEAIETLFSGRHKDDLLLLYFSGHGIKDETGRLYLATSQTRKNPKGELIKATAIAAKVIHEMMENSRSRRQVIILDCCFSGAFAEGMKAKSDNSLDIKNQLGGEGRAVLTSSTSTQYSFEQEGEELSVYTRYIVEGIEKGAADTDNDGMISVDELHEYACKKVQEAAPAMKPELYAIKEGFKIKLAKAPLGDHQLDYRKEVERWVRDGKVSVTGRRILKRRQSELGLSVEIATQIENEVLEPYRKYQENLREYEEALVEAIQDEEILNQHTQAELKRLQQLLQLRDEDIANIEARFTSQSKREWAHKVAKNITSKSATKENDLSSEKGVDYTKLRDLLAAGKWKDADYETYVLMLQVVGRKENDWIRDEELLNFPCTDLRTIDRLWVKYSNGRFGFSVQKEIYLSVGGKPGGKYDEQAWKKFGDRVGWRVESNWIVVETYNTSAPRGHLPSRVSPSYEISYRILGGKAVGYLFSRLETCKV